MAESFGFRTTPDIRIGPGRSREAGQCLAALGCRRVALVTDRGVLDAGLTGPASAGLAEAGIEAVVLAGTTADPPEAEILAAVAEAREAGVDGVLGLGGGSPMDSAKLVAALLPGRQEIGAIYGVDRVIGARLPLVLVPTTAGTGSEVTPVAIVTTGEAEKAGVVSPHLIPDAALLDPRLTLGLPPAVTAATGIDAIVHAIEAVTSARLRNPVADALARRALALLARNLEAAVTTPGDLAARGAMLLGSMLAGMAFANAPVAAVHALAYPIGGRFHVPHGLSNALVLAPVLAFNRVDPGAEADYASLAPIVFPHLAGLVPAAAVDGLIDGLARLGPRLGLPARLAEVGIAAADLPAMAAAAMKQTRLLVNNPRPLGESDALAIYRSVL